MSIVVVVVADGEDDRLLSGAVDEVRVVVRGT